MKSIAVHEGLVYMTPDMAAELEQHNVTPSVTPYGSGSIHTIPYDIEAIRLLRNLHVPIKTPLIEGRGEHYGFPGKFAPYQHQLKTSDFLAAHGRALCLNSPGCFDSETEYLSPTGWVKFKDYKGGKVAQYHLDGRAEFVEPIQYVKLPCQDMIRIKGRGVDQLLSAEHRVLANYRYGVRQRVVSAADVLRDHTKLRHGFKATFPSTFVAGREGIPMSDDQLRLHVAISADGYVQRKTANTTRYCVVRLKRTDKIVRMTHLLSVTGTSHSRTVCKTTGFTKFGFATMLPKGLRQLWAASNAQLKVISSELFLWDGSSRKSKANTFYTGSREDADFAQYALSATGRTTSVTVVDRRHTKPNTKSIEYIVYARARSVNLGVSRPENHGKIGGVWVEPSTDGFKYCFEVPTTFLVVRRNGCVVVSGNTGKTASVVWAADYLMNLGIVKRVLVVCPKSCVEEVWVKEIFGINPSRVVHALTGPSKARKELLKQPSQWVITNHDACTHLVAALADPSTGFDLVIADEATAFKTESASRTKGFKKIVQGKNFWLLTGTPTPQDPTDAYMLCKLINPNAPQTMARFQNETMYRMNQYLWLPKPDAVKTVAKYMVPSIRFDKKDCLDMPPITFEVRRVPLTKEQTDAIKDLRTQWVFEAKGDRVMADRAAVRLSKILQIGQGCVIGDTGVIQLDVSPRVQAVVDLIAESESKTIVFASFRASLERLHTELSKHYGVEVVHGDVSSSDRSKVFDAFKNDPKCRVLLAHPATTSHGLTLTSASTTIWFGPYQKFEAFEQANERMNRPGQKHDMRIIGLEGMTEERLVFNAARKAGDTQADLMELKRLLEM